MGGSYMSTGDEASRFARFHFRPHFYQHAGVRLASGTGPKQTSCADSPPPHVGAWDPSTKHASQEARDAAAAEALQQQLLSAYGSPEQLLAGGALAAVGLPGAQYPARVAGMVLDAAKKLGVPLGAALDVGAGVGATAFHLAAGGFESVLGVDHDVRAVAAAAAAQQAGAVTMARKVRCAAVPGLPAASTRCTVAAHAPLVGPPTPNVPHPTNPTGRRPPAHERGDGGPRRRGRAGPLRVPPDGPLLPGA